MDAIEFESWFDSPEGSEAFTVCDYDDPFKDGAWKGASSLSSEGEYLMCYAIIRIKYKAVNESPALIAVDGSEIDLQEKIGEICTRPEVQKITTFYPHRSRELVSEWKEVTHEKGN